MGNLTIPDLDDVLKASLSARAELHGHSMEEEALAILRGALAPTPPPIRPEESFGDAIHALFAPLGGVDLDLPLRHSMRDLPDFAQ